MGKSKKGGLVIRQRAALARLETQYEEFKKAGVDKAPWTTTRNGRIIHHRGRTFNEECGRLQAEIDNLKSKLSKHI